MILDPPQPSHRRDVKNRRHQGLRAVTFVALFPVPFVIIDYLLWVASNYAHASWLVSIIDALTFIFVILSGVVILLWPFVLAYVCILAILDYRDRQRSEHEA